MKKIGIVDCGSGNLRSVAKAFEWAARSVGPEWEVMIIEDARALSEVDRVVLPGVGAFKACREGVDAREGLLEALEKRVHGEGCPFLGICVGMQLLASEGHEHTISKGLGWIPGIVAPLRGEAAMEGLKIPHMGWNTLECVRPHPLLEGLPEPLWEAYFVHSYRFIPDNEEDVVLRTSYGVSIPAMIARGVCVGVQFHPEKSQGFGLSLLASFIRWPL